VEGRCVLCLNVLQILLLILLHSVSDRDMSLSKYSSAGYST